MTGFITDAFENIIALSVIDSMVPKLMDQHKKILHKYLYGVIQMIASCYGFNENIDEFHLKLTQNDSRDLKWLFTCILPFIDQSRKNLNELTTLEELYSLRYDSVKSKCLIQSECIQDINYLEPKYVFTNLQYGRFERGENFSTIHFKESHLHDNYYLLLNTIKTTRYKMYINWIDIIPYRMDNFKTSQLWSKTKEKIENQKYEEVDPVDDYPLDKYKDQAQIKILDDKIQGLNIEDIYDTLSMDLYNSIVGYKWMIFDIGVRFTINQQIKIVAQIQVLDCLIDLENCIKDKKWDTLNDDQKYSFSKSWDLLVQSFNKTEDIMNQCMVISNKAIKTIVKSIIVFFDMKYKQIETTDKKYKPLDKIREQVDDYDERMKDVTDNAVRITLNSIDHFEIYDYFRESIQGFKNTWYATYLMTNSKTRVAKANEVQGYTDIGVADQIQENISFKNIYNFCKSMVHVTKHVVKNEENEEKWYSEEYQKLPESWYGLNQTTKQIILDRINNKVPRSEWFNINRNIFFVIREIHKEGEKFDKASPNIKNKIKSINDLIYKKIKDSMTDIIFEVMITKGVLSKIIADNDLTDQKMYDTTIQTQRNQFVSTIAKKRFGSSIQENPYYENSYYYLTNLPFGEKESFYIKLKDVPEDYDYFKICSTSKTAWYLATAFHWVAQLGFCHRFINNRVSFMTGATGAGKSTQIPKMFVYYLKAIDHINDPTVIITVPRTNVTTGVSGFVSQELAVPYEEINKKTGRIEKNDNYYVQYKHRGDNKHLFNGNFPKLRFITDGSVLQDVKDPLIKNKKNSSNPWGTIYSRKNKYDVVIVDEAHEHNQNMDMILTLMKNAMFYNNKLRLCIMSATIEADEPTYRCFYRDVNDNRKYPLNQWIKTHGLDRINTDRRFHISAPNQTTRFKITDIPRPGENPDQIVKEIIDSSSSGDILYFQPGTAEITKSLNVLNALGFLPDNVIAIPYHAKLPKPVLDFIKNIEKNIKNLRIDKSFNLSQITDSEELFTGNSEYNRFVLIATNIAEASITIDSLKFVVDTGIEKTMTFDFERRSNILKVNPITDASRIQRRGRVGRVSSGTVYYTYAPQSLENNKKQFGISIQDIHQTVFLDLIKEPNEIQIFTDTINKIVAGTIVEKHKVIKITKDDLNKIFMNYRVNPVNEQLFIDNILDILNNHKTLPVNKKQINTLITSSYTKIHKTNTINNTFKQIISDIIGLIDNEKYHTLDQSLNKNRINQIVQQDYQRLLTNKFGGKITDDLSFINSIIDFLNDHYISNDILYDYHGKDNMYDYENIVYPPKIYFSGFDIEQLTDANGSFYLIHPDELMIKRNIGRNIVSSDGYAVITKNKVMNSKKILVFWETLLNTGLVGNDGPLNVFKTKLGSMLQFCMSNLTIFRNIGLMNALFFGYGLSMSESEFEPILNVCCYLEVIDSTMKKIISQEVLKKYSDPRDSRTKERELFDVIKKTFTHRNQQLDSDLTLLQNIVNQIDDIITASGFSGNIYKTNYFSQHLFQNKNIRGIMTGFPDDLKRTEDGIIERDQRLEMISKQFNNDMTHFFESTEAKNLIQNLGLDTTVLRKFYELREFVRRKWTDLVNNTTLSLSSSPKNSGLTTLKQTLIKHREYIDELSIPLTKSTFMLANPNPYNIMKKIPDTDSSYIPIYNPSPDTIMTLRPMNTFIDPMFYQNYVLYLSENLDENTIGTLININPMDLKLCANIYNITIIKRKFYNQKLSPDYIHQHIDQYSDKMYNSSSSQYQVTQTNTSQTPMIDFRIYNVPEHLRGIINIRKALDQTLPDIYAIQDSRIWFILQNISKSHSTYGNKLKKIHKN